MREKNDRYGLWHQLLSVPQLIVHESPILERVVIDSGRRRRIEIESND